MALRLRTRSNQPRQGEGTGTPNVVIRMVGLFAVMLAILEVAFMRKVELSFVALSAIADDLPSYFYFWPVVDPDKDCPFRHSPLYRSVYVYPSPGDDEWQGEILSEHGKSQNYTYPWIAIDNKTRSDASVHYNIDHAYNQFSTELFVRDLMTHPDSCLRTKDPEKATLFYVPYLPSVEFKNGKGTMGDFKTSPFGEALTDATRGKYQLWEKRFGLTSKFWKLRNGSDHILVFSEPMHGLWHPKMKRGNFHFVNSQNQLTPPIVISVELSTTFIEMYPNCARKNIVMPYPNNNGKWFNGVLDREASERLKQVELDNVQASPAALEAEKELARVNSTNPRQQPRPLAQYYKAGMHGSCTTLRKSMRTDYSCSDSQKVVNALKIQNYAHAYRQATFCPCPGGDSPSAKRMFDALHAGCIPVVLSYDYVWPFTAEFDIVAENGSAVLLDPNDFSIRLKAEDYVTAKHDDQCGWLNDTSRDLQAFLESITAEEIQRLRRGVEKAADVYAYYRRREDLPDNPMAEGVLPDGGAAHALIAALSERSSGALWPACQEELSKLTPGRPDPKHFKC